MKTLKLVSAALLLNLAAFSQDKYQYEMDLSKVENDLMPVTLTVPQMDADEVEFQMPKIVPGTYSIYDFGRFVSGFVALDAEGNELLTKRLTDNRWQIFDAKKLHKVLYRVEDTFDTKKDNKVFEPGGTNIEADKNFVMNTFGFFGYFKDKDDIPFHITINHPENMYGGSALIKAREEAGVDEFVAPNYFDLADSPIMYCEPDTVKIPVGNCEVLVSVYSPNGVLKAEELREPVANIMDAQRKYLGGTLPVDRYAILMYLFDGMSGSGGAGALEHSYSTLFSLPEQSAEDITQTVLDVTAHEFFHIVTPLNIHSEHIHDYDFINPQMSQHLWLYEGVTEYAAQHVQVKYDLMSQEDFLKQMRQKILTSKFYNDTLPFTTMSKKALDEHANQYTNVYQKGALIGMCLDLELISLSNGEYNLQMLMKDLSKKYGTQQAFEDEKLFDIITELTYPEIRTFFTQYVDGNNPLPYKTILEKAGVNYIDSKEVSKITLGSPGLGYNEETKRLVINNLFNANQFAKDLGFEEGDELVSVNGISISGDFRAKIQEFQDNTQEGDKIKVVVMRDGKEKTLKAKAMLVTTNERYFLEMIPNASEKQLAVRKAWLVAQDR